jgi:predicted amidophosphoribosyltransferase
MIAFSYNQIIKKLIMSLKYYHKKDIAKYLAERLYYLLLTNELIEKD